MMSLAANNTCIVSALYMAGILSTLMLTSANPGSDFCMQPRVEGISLKDQNSRNFLYWDISTVHGRVSGENLALRDGVKYHRYTALLDISQ